MDNDTARAARLAAYQRQILDLARMVDSGEITEERADMLAADALRQLDEG